MSPRPMLRLSLVVALPCLLLLSGCGGLLPERAPPSTTYQLNVSLAPEQAPSGPRVPGVLALAMPQAAAGYDTVEMAYRQSPHELSYYAHSQWVAPPAAMIRQALSSTLAASGLFGGVETDPPPVPARYRLYTELVRLEQDFTAKPSIEHLTLRLRLVDERDKRLLGTRLIDVSAPTGSEDASGGVTAANQALTDALKKIVVFCAETLAAQ